IEWLFFVCPEKTEQRTGLEWAAALDLAPIVLCRAIGRLPNAALGNHTNSHQRPVLSDDFAAEIGRSRRDFERLFGRQEPFAIPYGVPGEDFSDEHVEGLEDLVIWST